MQTKTKNQNQKINKQHTEKWVAKGERQKDEKVENKEDQKWVSYRQHSVQ